MACVDDLADLKDGGQLPSEPEGDLGGQVSLYLVNVGLVSG